MRWATGLPERCDWREHGNERVKLVWLAFRKIKYMTQGESIDDVAMCYSLVWVSFQPPLYIFGLFFLRLYSKCVLEPLLQSFCDSIMGNWMKLRSLLLNEMCFWFIMSIVRSTKEEISSGEFLSHFMALLEIKKMNELY